MSDPGTDEAQPGPSPARHRAHPRRGTGRGLLVVLAVAAVVLVAGAVAALVVGGESTSTAPAAGSPTVTSSAAASPAATSPTATSPTGPGPTGPAGTSPASSPAPAAQLTDGAPAAGSSASAASPSGPAVPGPAGVAAGSDAPAPVSLRMPAIGVDESSLDRLGVADDGTIEVPQDPDDAGWLTASAAPGATGPAVIAGHVDTRDGPAVFARLGELAAGDEVDVGLEDGTTVTYVVTASETYPKTEFPTERVYGPAPAPVLRLITCGGDFDRTVSSYEDNVVVYAVLAG